MKHLLITIISVIVGIVVDSTPPQAGLCPAGVPVKCCLRDVDTHICLVWGCNCTTKKVKGVP